MFDIVRSLQKVKTQVLRSSKSAYFFLMIHKLRKNKRRSFSAATNLRNWRKKRSYQVKYAVFLQFKEKDTAFPQLSYKKRRFYAGLKKSAAFLQLS